MWANDPVLQHCRTCDKRKLSDRKEWLTLEEMSEREERDWYRCEQVETYCPECSEKQHVEERFPPTG